MNVCFVPFLPPGWLYRILLMKIHQWNSNLKSSLSEFNIKWVTLQSHKLWYWQSDLLRSWINLPIKMHVYCPESNASYAFLWKHIQRAQQNHLIEQILSHRSLFLNIVTTISYPFSPVMNKSACWTHNDLYGHPERGFSFKSLPPLLKNTTHHLTMLTSSVWCP